MRKPRYSQLFAVPFLSASCMILSQKGAYSLEGVLGAGLAVLVQCVVFVLLFKPVLSDKKNVWEKLLNVLFLCSLLFRGGITMIGLQQIIPRFSLPIASTLVVTLLLVLVCFYAASCGMQALFRSSTVVLGIFLIALLLLMIGAIPKGTSLFLSLSMEETVWGGFWRWMYFMDLLPFLSLLRITKASDSPKPYLLTFVCIWLLYGILSLTVLSIFGHGASQAEYPFFALLAVSQPLLTQRGDAIFLIVFVMLYVLRFTFFTTLSEHILKSFFPKIRPVVLSGWYLGVLLLIGLIC